jgi:site-specific DNA-cytosine methylase
MVGKIDVSVWWTTMQGFSQKGKRLSLDDERNYLFKYF